MKRPLLPQLAILTIALTIGIFIFTRWNDSRNEDSNAEDSHPDRSRGRLVTPESPAGDQAGPSAGTDSPLPTKSGRPLESQPHPTGKPPGYPFADKIANRPGFVISPFTGEPVDVRGIPAGTLVRDPAAPADMDKPYFRVPESAVNEAS